MSANYSDFVTNQIGGTYKKEATSPTGSGTSQTSFLTDISSVPWGNWWEEDGYRVGGTLPDGTNFSFFQFDSTMTEMGIVVKATKETGWFNVYSSSDGTNWTLIGECTANISFVRAIGYQIGTYLEWTLPSPLNKWDSSCTEEAYNNNEKVNIEFWFSWGTTENRFIRIVDKGIGMAQSGVRTLGGTKFKELIVNVNTTVTEWRPFTHKKFNVGGAFGKFSLNYPSGIAPFVGNKIYGDNFGFLSNDKRYIFQENNSCQFYYDIYPDSSTGDIWANSICSGTGGVQTENNYYTQGLHWLNRFNKSGYFIGRWDMWELAQQSGAWAYDGTFHNYLNVNFDTYWPPHFSVDGTNMFMIVRENNSSNYKQYLVKYLFDGTNFTYDKKISLGTSNDGNFRWMVIKAGIIHLLDCKIVPADPHQGTFAIWKYDANLNYVAKIDMMNSGLGYRPWAVRLDIPDDNKFYISGNLDRLVFVFSSIGEYLYQFGASGSNTVGALVAPQGVAVDSAGRLFVGDQNCYQVWRGDGYHEEGSPGSAGDVAFVVAREDSALTMWQQNNPVPVPRSYDGLRDELWTLNNSYFGDSYDPAKFALIKDCKPVIDSTSTSLFYDCTNKITVTKEIEIFSVDGTNIVYGYDVGGGIRYSPRTISSGLSGLNQPNGLAVDGTNLFISDINHRIMKFNKTTGANSGKIVDESLTLSAHNDATTVSAFNPETLSLNVDGTALEYGNHFITFAFERSEQMLSGNIGGYSSVYAAHSDMRNMNQFDDKILFHGVVGSYAGNQYGMHYDGTNLYRASSPYGITKVGFDSNMRIKSYDVHDSTNTSNTINSNLGVWNNKDYYFIDSPAQRVKKYNLDTKAVTEVCNLNWTVLQVGFARFDSTSNNLIWMDESKNGVVILDITNGNKRVIDKRYTSADSWAYIGSAEDLETNVLRYADNYYFVGKSHMFWIGINDSTHSYLNLVDLPSGFTHSGGNYCAVVFPEDTSIIVGGIDSTNNRILARFDLDTTAFTVLEVFNTNANNTLKPYALSYASGKVYYMNRDDRTDYGYPVMTAHEDWGGATFYNASYSNALCSWDGTTSIVLSPTIGWLTELSSKIYKMNDKNNFIITGDITKVLNIPDATSTIQMSYIPASCNSMFYASDSTADWGKFDAYRFITSDIKAFSGVLYCINPFFETTNVYEDYENNVDSTGSYIVRMIKRYDEFTPKISLIDSSGSLQSSFLLFAGYADNLALNHDGTTVSNIWVPYPVDNVVRVYTTDGTAVEDITHADLDNPYLVAMHGANMYVACFDKVVVFNKTTRAYVDTISHSLTFGIKDITSDGTNLWVLNYQKLWKVNTTTFDPEGVIDLVTDLFDGLIFDYPSYHKVVFDGTGTFYISVNSYNSAIYNTNKGNTIDRIVKYTL